MITLNQMVVVEGKYDKIRLSNLIDALIITTDGFGIFKNKEKAELIKKAAKGQGIIVMTDSDNAGFIIRNYINNITQGSKVIHVCLPEILGKEKRKAKPSAQNLVGVEGTPDGVILKALEKYGVLYKTEPKQRVTKLMLYEDGFSGSKNCTERRNRLLQMLDIPKAVSPQMLPDVITQMAGYERYKEVVESLDIKIGQNT